MENARSSRQCQGSVWYYLTKWKISTSWSFWLIPPKVGKDDFLPHSMSVPLKVNSNSRKMSFTGSLKNASHTTLLGWLCPNHLVIQFILNGDNRTKLGEYLLLQAIYKKLPILLLKVSNWQTSFLQLCVGGFYTDTWKRQMTDNL